MELAHLRRRPHQPVADAGKRRLGEVVLLHEHALAVLLDDSRDAAGVVDLAVRRPADADDRRHDVGGGVLGASLERRKPARREEHVVVDEHDMAGC